jgi:hypothetical protein
MKGRVFILLLFALRVGVFVPVTNQLLFNFLLIERMQKTLF